MEVYNQSNKTCYLDVPVVPITFCTEELKYTDPDSHFIHIPRSAYHNFLNLKSKHGKSDMPLYVGVRNNNDRKKRLCFGRVEPSIITPNSDHDTMLLPEWALKLLGIEFAGRLDLVYVIQPQSIGYLKIKGNKSCYVKYSDVRALLESKLSNYNCLNMGESFTINEDSIGDYAASDENSVTFTITELKSKDGKDIEFGAIYDVEVNIDFELPEDLERIEKERITNSHQPSQPTHSQLPPRVLQKAITQIPSVVKPASVEIVNGNIIHHETHNVGSTRHYGARLHTMNDSNDEATTVTGKNKEEHKPFEGPGLTLASTAGAITKKLTREEILAMRLQKMKGESESK